MIDVQNLYAGYGGADVIRNISFKAKKGEILCVLGPNGCGKTTLLKSLARIIGYRGIVTLDDRDTALFPRRELAQKIALLSQSTQVFFPYTVYETVSMGRYAYLRGFLKNLSAKDRAIIDNIIDTLDLGDIRNCMVDEISGGTLQRVFLARTLAQTPALILLDEPSNHLDLKHQIELLALLESWVKEHNTTVIGVLHDLNMARRFGDTVMVMNNGILVAHGNIKEVLNSEILSNVYGIDIRALYPEIGSHRA